MPGSGKITIDLAMLQKHGLFSGISEGELNDLAASFHIGRWSAGERIIAEGEPNGTLYFVYQGAVDIFKRVKVREGSRDEKIASLATGDTFGEMALLDQQPRSASVVASIDSIVLALDHAHLGKIDPRTYAKMLINLTREVSRHLRVTDQYFATSLFSIHEQARFRLFPKE